jgi:peptide-methionine (S)-S-oxide reductase
MLRRRSILSLALSAIAISLIGAARNDARAQDDPTETLTLGGGCFWCLEAVYREINGVLNVESGYSGGRKSNPDYKDVASGRTGHAEVVQITFDPRRISRDILLKVYFTIHDPTTVDRQGDDIGSQYRSIAFYRNEEQKAAIEKAIAGTVASGDWRGRIVTQVAPFKYFYKAGNYHKQYFELHGEDPYCKLVIAPKMVKFRKRFHDLLKASAG